MGIGYETGKGHSLSVADEQQKGCAEG